MLYSSAPAALDPFDRPFAHPPNVPTYTKGIGYPRIESSDKFLEPHKFHLAERLNPLYKLITRHYLASIADPMVYKEKTMK